MSVVAATAPGQPIGRTVRSCPWLTTGQVESWVCRAVSARIEQGLDATVEDPKILDSVARLLDPHRHPTPLPVLNPSRSATQSVKGRTDFRPCPPVEPQHAQLGP